MGEYSYQKDLSRAKKTELEVAGYLKENFGWEFVRTNDDYKYDLIFKKNSRRVTVEVKEDFLNEKTGNIAVEYSCRGKDSGISKTKAEYWVYKLHRKNGEFKYLFITTNMLRKLVETEKYKRKVDGGDWNSHSLCYLFDADLVGKHGKVLLPN